MDGFDEFGGSHADRGVTELEARARALETSIQTLQVELQRVRDALVAMRSGRSG